MFFNRQSVAGPRIYNFFKAFRANEGSSLPVGVAGFCWGGLWTAKLCADTEKTADGRSLIDAGFTAHPSMLSVPADIERVKLPLSIANGTKDFQLTPPLMEQTKEIFSKKDNCELVVFDGAKHGFAVRSNPNDEREKKQELGKLNSPIFLLSIPRSGSLTRSQKLKIRLWRGSTNGSAKWVAQSCNHCLVYHGIFRFNLMQRVPSTSFPVCSARETR